MFSLFGFCCCCRCDWYKHNGIKIIIKLFFNKISKKMQLFYFACFLKIELVIPESGVYEKSAGGVSVSPPFACIYADVAVLLCDSKIPPEIHISRRFLRKLRSF